VTMQQIPDLKGTTLGQYVLQDFVGKGGMGVVYRAYQERLKRDVAVKILAGVRANQPEQIKRFNREAETAALLEHPHIVPIYDYGTQDDMNFVVMRFLGGGSLSDRILQAKAGQRPHMSLHEVANLLRQVGSALDYAHNKGVIHRDIKPSNVMFDDYDNAFLVDFGLVKLMDSSQGTLTSSGMILGTPTYMAPEQWLDQHLTPAIDQYALGVIVYTLVTDQLPFDANKPYDLMRLHCYERAQPPHEIVPDVPPAVSEVIEQAMAKTTEERFPTVIEFANAFMKAITIGARTGVPAAVEDEAGATLSSQGTNLMTLKPEDFPDDFTMLPKRPSAKKAARASLRVDQSRDRAMVGQVVPIESFPFEIGRMNRHLNFDNDKNVSRNHAHIFVDNNGDYYLEDQGSTLNTMIQDVQIQPFAPVKLEHNDIICLGTTTFLTFFLED
jgi:serine/threonine protein kinase